MMFRPRWPLGCEIHSEFATLHELDLVGLKNTRNVSPLLKNWHFHSVDKGSEAFQGIFFCRNYNLF